MVAVMRCEDVADRLERNSVFGDDMEFSEAWRRGTWAGSQPHLALLILEDEVRWLGRAQGGKVITTTDRIVRVTDIEEVDPLSVAELREALPRRHRNVLERTGILPPGGAKAVVSTFKELRPYHAELIDRLQRPLDLHLPSGNGGQLLNQERDGLGLLLDLGGVGRRVLRSWSSPTVGVPFLAGIPQSAALEDNLISHDVERFGSWVSLPNTQVEWRAFTDGTRRMFIMNANRTAVEHTLGVDVVYWNEHEDSFVLVQYKKMRREDRSSPVRPELIYRPDHNLASELERMKQIDERCSKELGDFRLSPTPCWLKLCDPDARISDPAELIKGMYFPREHFEELLEICIGPRGGVGLTYENVRRYLSNTTFIDLVRDGWIGSRGAATSELRDLVRKSIETGHAVVVGVRT